MSFPFRAVCGLFVVWSTTGAAPFPVSLASNRATYDVSLAHTLPGSIVAARGRIVIEFRDTCDGWSTTQRFIADMTNGEGTVQQTDFLVSAWESKDGRTMRFDIVSRADGKVIEKHKGAATASSSANGEVVLSGAKPTTFPLPPGTLFPTAQTLGMLSAARGGQAIANANVFQGGDTSDLYYSTATVGRAVSPARLSADRVADASALLKGQPAWPVLVSYYSKGAEVPEYEVGSRLYANGIIGSMSLIYARFTLQAKLARVEPLAPACGTGAR